MKGNQHEKAKEGAMIIINSLKLMKGTKIKFYERKLVRKWKEKKNMNKQEIEMRRDTARNLD